MSSRLGDLFKCADADCGFEVLVVHDSAKPARLEPCPMCCCGKPMLPRP